METITQWSNVISDNKRKSIIQLIYRNIENSDEREQWLNMLELASEYDAEEIIENLVKQ